MTLVNILHLEKETHYHSVHADNLSSKTGPEQMIAEQNFPRYPTSL